MTSRTQIRICIGLATMLLVPRFSLPQATLPVLDRVVAVVNNRAILSSDLNEEMRLSVLEPRNATAAPSNARNALRRLISRTLIQQQIRQEDIQNAQPTEQQVQARLTELRRSLPICIRMNCATDAGWKVFLATNDLTQAEVEHYLRMRLEILAFIESRFRQGIRISQDDIDQYYRDTLVPQYGKGETVPSLQSVAPRIEEILLQQEVNVLFSSWLDNLRKQGDIEVLDPALETSGLPAGDGANE